MADPTFGSPVRKMPTLINFPTVLAFCLMAFSLPATATPPTNPSVVARLGSCDAVVVRKAVDELLVDPKTLREPLMLFYAASGEYMAGQREEAAYLYLAARLRTSRQVLFEKGDRPQLLSVMLMTVGTMVMPILEADPELAQRAVKRAIEWDRSTLDPFRERDEAKSDEIAKKIAAIDEGLAHLPDQLRNDSARVARARQALDGSERQLKDSYAQRCGPGTLDPADAEPAAERIKRAAESLVRTNSFAVSQAGGEIKSASVTSFRMAPSRLPTRITVAVNPTNGKMFYAEVDADPAITPERKLGAVQMSLACITDLSLGYRDARWKDVCTDDVAARKPSAAAGELKPFDFAADETARQTIAKKGVQCSRR